jgi:hypothetical protein
VGEESLGKRIYTTQCVACHGIQGEGVPGKYEYPLIGEDSERTLARYIDRFMPEGDAEKCTGEEAEAVARYIHNTFYSAEAQARKNPVRASLSRLTSRQFQNSAADLIGRFRPPPVETPEEGLRGRYFKSGNLSGEAELERLDATIDFQFSEDCALGAKMDPAGFSAQWTGSLRAPETGKYRFTLRTDYAARLWVNDLDTHLIDAWVKSGSDTEFSGTVHLLGGRNYPLKLEFSSKIQGVEDKFESQNESLEGFLQLDWSLPHRPPERIPSRHFGSVLPPEVFVLETALPPDDRSDGYERGKTVSKAWDEAATEAAIEIADYVVENLPGLVGAKEGEEGYPEKVREFCELFAAHAFRAPLTENQRRFYIDRQFMKTPDLETAVKRVVLLTLKSPKFLYTDLIDPPSEDYSVASVLSFALWDSLPDRALLEKAAAGGLHEHDLIVAEAERMVEDPRGQSKVREFFHYWLKIEEAPELGKQQDLFPDFNDAIASDMRTSLDLFLEEVIGDRNSDFRDLMVCGDLYVNGRLGRFLGYDIPEEASFERRSPKESERSSLLTHPYLMTRFAHHDTTSPIHRGVFLVRNILGRSLRPPPEAITPEPPELHPHLTTRERVELQTKAQSCQTCHSLINPLGFTLEEFDAVGRIRATEVGKPLDTSGSYVGSDGNVVEFQGPRDLADFLVAHRETHQAFAVQLHHYLVKQPVNAFGTDTAAKLTDYFRENDLNLRRLVCHIGTQAALAKVGGTGGESSPTLAKTDTGEKRGAFQQTARPRTFLGLFTFCSPAQTNRRWR